MRILVVSNLYPPLYVGGYELGCFDVVNQLSSRGHGVAVLTSTWGVSRRCIEGRVYRWLEADLGLKDESKRRDFARLARKEFTNRRAFLKVLRELKPDVVYFWNLTHLSIALAFYAQVLELSSCYFVSDKWISNWEADLWFDRWQGVYGSLARRARREAVRSLFRLLGMMPSGDLKLQHVHFASRYLKEVAMAAGKKVPEAEVIHWGIDVARFPYQPLIREPKRILYVGQIVPHKGVRTAIEAMNILVNSNGRRDVRLTIVGGSLVPSYVDEMHQLTAHCGLQQHVEFAGPVPREQLPSVYPGHDILVFPSIIDEGLAIVLLEALSSGLAVVGTDTGGDAEILQHGFNALVFPKEDAQACAGCMLRLLDNPELFQKLRQNGRHTVETSFSLQGMVDAIEDSLERIAGRNRKDTDPKTSFGAVEILTRCD